MNLALNNTENAIKYYSGKGESIEVEIVAYGPGLNMLREDTSPGRTTSRPEGVEHWWRCPLFRRHNTQMAMEKREGHPINHSRGYIVPAGIVRLTQLRSRAGATFAAESAFACSGQ